MNTNRKGEKTGENNNMCSASANASADTVINESTVCVQSGLARLANLPTGLYILFIVKNFPVYNRV